MDELTHTVLGMPVVLDPSAPIGSIRIHPETMIRMEANAQKVFMVHSHKEQAIDAAK